MKRNRLSLANSAHCERVFSKTKERLQKIQYKFKNCTFRFRFLQGPELDDKEAGAAADIMDANVRRFLEGSSMGWNREEKIAELRNPSSRVVLIHRATNGQAGNGEDIAAFLCLRFELEDLEDLESPPVLYCYEIHVTKSYRRFGLGRFLVEEMIRIAKEWNMEKVMLTVMRSNTEALLFYEAMKFEIDEASPGDTDYKILSLATN